MWFDFEADASVPPIYRDALDTVDPTGTGEVSVSSLIRVMATSLLPAATTDKVCIRSCPQEPPRDSARFPGGMVNI